MNTSSEIELLIKKLSANRNQGLDGFTEEFHQSMRRAKTYPSQTIPKNEEEGTHLDLFCEATIILLLKADKDLTKTNK